VRVVAEFVDLFLSVHPDHQPSSPPTPYTDIFGIASSFFMRWWCCYGVFVVLLSTRYNLEVQQMDQLI
jgi:hypothetical protein